jgi:ferredoxin
MKSILSNADKCYLCGSRIWIQHHHVYFGSMRKVSENNGFKVPLCRECHVGNNGVHFDIEKDNALKQECQTKYECTHSRQEFMSLIHRNYL